MKGMTVGLIYDLHEAYPWRPGDPVDADAEYEPIETVEALEQALEQLGHTTVRIGTARDLLREGPGSIDAAINIAEGAWTRNREGWVPTLLEMWGVPYTGSDALALSLSLDKVYTKQVAGVRTPAYAVVPPGHSAVVPSAFPLFVKPRYEGTAKGIRPTSVVHDLAALQREVAHVHESYQQDALVEQFIHGGGEYTVAVIGSPPRALPKLERAIDPATGIGSHALERHGVETWVLAGGIDASLEAEMQQMSLEVFNTLGCRDFARLDYRVDGNGTPWFLEINPLPTFAPDGTFAVLAELMGESYPDWLSKVLDEALNRALAEAGPNYVDHA
jgi:D-alanine-D-alanine ligase